MFFSNQNMSMKKKKKKKKKTRRDVGVIPIHFLRIVLGHDLNFNMPKKFVREYGNGLSESALIKAPTGPLWEVELKRGDGQVWFGKGWKEFVDYFSLKTGSSLVFRYEGHSRFNVLFIFDSDALETNYPNDICSSEEVNRDVKLRNPKVEDIESAHVSAGIMVKIPASKEMIVQEVVEIESDHDSYGIMGGDNPTHEKRMAIQEVVEIENDHDSAGTVGDTPIYKRMGIQDTWDVRSSGEGSHVELESQMLRKCKISNSPVKEASGGTSAARRCRSFEAPRKMQSLGTKREVRALLKDAGFKFEHPFFEVTMKPSHFTRAELYIPVTFPRRHFPEKAGDIILQNMDGRTWSACYKRYGGAYSSAWFFCGLKEFLLDNNLQVGDTCRFKLQNGLKMCFIVTISRVAENANQHFRADHGSKTGHAGHKRCLRSGSQFECGTSKREETTPPRTSKESNAPQKKIKTEHGMFPQMMRSDRAAGQSIRGLFSKGHVRAFGRASKVKANHPSFKVVITAGFLQRSSPTIPTRFCKEYLKCISKDVTLQMKDKLWSLKLVSSPRRLGRFGGGWLAFASENNLQLGDVCVFEMINATNPTVFKVTIFSASNV